MRTMLLALVVLPLLQGQAAAQENAEAGRMAWASNQLACRNCHGAQGQGAYGPDLAGRGLNTEQFLRAVRRPWGVMPAFIDKQISDTTAADLAAYFATLPKVATPGDPRWITPAGAPQGQQYIVMSYGCANCHMPELRDPRRVLGGEAADANFEFFAKRVYNHTDVYTDPVPRMGNFSKDRVPETVLREIYKFIHDDLGLLAPIVASSDAGVASGPNTTYTLTVENQGTKGKGLAADNATITMVLPAGSMVVSNTGAGFKGVARNVTIMLAPLPAGRGGAPAGGAPAGAAPAPAAPAAPVPTVVDTVTWVVPSVPAGEKQTYSVTLAGAPIPVAGFRGSNVKWGNVRKGLPNLVLRDPRTPESNDVANVTFPNPGRGGRGAPAPAGVQPPPPAGQ